MSTFSLANPGSAHKAGGMTNTRAMLKPDA